MVDLMSRGKKIKISILNFFITKRKSIKILVDEKEFDFENMQL